MHKCAHRENKECVGEQCLELRVAVTLLWGSESTVHMSLQPGSSKVVTTWGLTPLCVEASGRDGQLKPGPLVK